MQWFGELQALENIKQYYNQGFCLRYFAEVQVSCLVTKKGELLNTMVWWVPGSKLTEETDN